MPPVQYMATRFPAAFQSATWACTYSGKSRKLATPGSMALWKRPSRNSKLLRLSSSTTSSWRISSRHSAGLRLMPVPAVTSTPLIPSGTISFFRRTFILLKGTVLHSLRLNGMPAKDGMASRDASNASNWATVPATMPLIPSGATKTLPRNSVVSSRRASMTAATSSRGVNW